MDALARIQQTIAAQSLPDWVERVVVTHAFGTDDEPALDVVLVVRDDRAEVVNDGAQLAAARHVVHRALRESGVDLWPYTRFVSASDLAAA
jgi:tryptophan 2,3-dioxygenase